MIQFSKSAELDNSKYFKPYLFFYGILALKRPKGKFCWTFAVYVSNLSNGLFRKNGVTLIGMRRSRTKLLVMN